LWGGFLWAYLGCRPGLPAVLAQPLGRALAALGTVSFSTYVMHNLVIAAYNQRGGLLPLGPDAIAQSVWTGVLVLLPLVLALSVVTYFLIERPFLAYRVHYTRAASAGKS
jgi:peptidoglycan/LPS O-acetylase OafA/YrhL